MSPKIIPRVTSKPENEILFRVLELKSGNFEVKCRNCVCANYFE